MDAPLHAEQPKRLATLRSYDILDTPREEDFDEIVELASRLCETPISVINLIDEDRQWFKAEVGLNTRETPLPTSICAHVILQEEYVEIPDTLKDPRLSDNPLCLAEGGLRFYAGAPLLAPDGLPIGTLCVLDTKPRELNGLQRTALQVLSRQVMKQLELRRALATQDTLLHEADHRVKNSLQTLSSIVGLYRRKVTDPVAQEAFDAIQRRIMSVSALHGELQDSDVGTVKARDFLERVAMLLEGSGPENVRITSEADDITLSATAASALGMIVSEFAANSIKHGFLNGSDGRVTVSLKRVAGGLELECCDDGVGSGGIATEGSPFESLGSTLMRAAAAQINGELLSELSTDGCRLRLRF